MVCVLQELRKGAISRAVDLDQLEKGIKQSVIGAGVSCNGHAIDGLACAGCGIFILYYTG